MTTVVLPTNRIHGFYCNRIVSEVKGDIWERHFVLKEPKCRGPYRECKPPSTRSAADLHPSEFEKCIFRLTCRKLLASMARDARVILIGGTKIESWLSMNHYTCLLDARVVINQHLTYWMNQFSGFHWLQFSVRPTNLNSLLLPILSQFHLSFCHTRREFQLSFPRSFKLCILPFSLLIFLDCSTFKFWTVIWIFMSEPIIGYVQV